MKHGFWLIQGYEGTSLIYEKKISAVILSEEQLKALLKALVAKAGLSFDEIVGAYAKRKTLIANDLLHVQKDGPHPKYSCGVNPYFIARIV